jgi:EAL and modified HD-GYP domain-containing signal transduction protein
MTQTEIFLGRQPILDVRQNVVAYELLFRSGQTATSGVTDDMLATSTVIINTISQLGIDNVLDKQSGFVNVSYDLLMSDVLELLPHERIVLEILETVEIDDRAIARCRELKAMGFRLALDDFEYTPVYDPLFDVVDIIKFDVMLSDAQTIEQTLKVLKRWPKLQLLAEKVEDLEQFQCYQQLGFALFQGYFFAKPAILSGKKTNPNQVTLMRVLSLLMSDGEIPEIERIFKESPNLTLGLLRLVNSVGMGMRNKIGSLHQALVVLGRRQLLRWVQLLLYAQDGGGAVTSPLMQLAATRAKTMELLSQCHPDKRYHTEDARDIAFMTGILSLVDALLGKGMEEVLGQLGLVDEVKSAVLLREGFLGQLLTLVEKSETGDFVAVTALLEQLNLSWLDLHRSSLEAMQWVSSLSEEADN